MPTLRVEPAAYALWHAAIHAVRDAVFVLEQGVPVELEHDALDPACTHVLAWDELGRPVGTGRLTPEGRIGRMAVLAEARNQQVGQAVLEALVGAARAAGLAQVVLHAQLPARDFYARQGFLPEGPEFIEADIAHQQMARDLQGPVAVDGLAAAQAITVAVAHRARRQLWLHSPLLDPALLQHAPVQQALRRFCTQRQDTQLRVLVHDAAAIARAGSPLLVLMQRLPSVVRMREVADPADRALTSACFVNDNGDYYFRMHHERLDGNAGIALPPRSQAFTAGLQRVWDRSRDCSELRALGL